MEKTTGLQIDIKNVFYRTLRHWYLVVISLFIGFGIAYYNNLYLQSYYSITSSVIINQKEDTNGAELLYNNALINQFRNYLNEPYILRSLPLIKKTVEELNFTVAIYSDEGYIPQELYTESPIKITRLGNLNLSNEYFIEIIDKGTYSLQRIDPNNQNKIPKNNFIFGEKILIDSDQLLVELNKTETIQDHIGKTYRLVLMPSIAMSDEYINKLDIRWAEQGSGVMFINLSGQVAQKEVDFINGLVTNYQEYDLAKKNLTATRTVAFIKKQITQISDSLSHFEEQLEMFKLKNRTISDLSSKAFFLYNKVEGIQGQKMEVLVKKNYYDYLERYLAETKNLDQVISPSSLGIIDPVLSNLVSKIGDLQLELKLIVEKERSQENPLIINKINKLKELKAEMLESLKGLKAADKIKLKILDEQIGETEGKMGFLPLAQRQYLSIMRDYSLLEKTYNYLLQKKSEAEISKAANLSDVVFINPPRTQGGPITPNSSKNYLLALFLSLGLPLVLFAVLEVLNTRVQSKDDIEKFTTIPIIGGIGHKKGDNNLQVMTAPKSVMAESFRALRSNLNYFIDKKEKVVFLVASSISGEGKSFTSLNLASVLSLSDKKTLILGADLRKPNLYKDLDCENTIGLSSYLAGIADFKDAVQKTKYKNLDLVSAGAIPPNPSELLLLRRMDAFMQLAKEEYDYIVIDSPPIALVSDAFPLAKYADHIIFLVRQKYTPKVMLKAVDDYVKSGKLKNVSILFNDIYTGIGYEYSDAYSYAYGYGKRKDGTSYYSE